MEISIIIPVYNVSSFIEKCIKSLVDQSFKNFECIIVNDGTKDNSIKLVEGIIKRDKRFKVFHQKNQGQGMARNLGLKHAQGNYICFIDADDFVEPNYLEVMYREIEKQKADVVCCGFNIITKDKLSPHVVSLEASSNIESILHLLNGNDWGSLFNRMFKSELIKDLRFKKGIGQDKPFIFELFVKNPISKVVFIDQCLYNYIIRKKSATNSMSKVKIDNLIENMIVNPQNLVRQSNYYGNCKRALEHYLVMSYLYIISNIAKNSNQFVPEAKYFKNKFSEVYDLKLWASIKLLVHSQLSLLKKVISVFQLVLSHYSGLGFRFYKLIYVFKKQSLN
jgi:glycosyltransferase involved in cell wall biosynthesis